MSTDRIVRLEPSARLHSLYEDLVRYPPEGYKVISGIEKAHGVWDKIQTESPVRELSTGYLANIMPLSLVLPFLRSKRPNDNPYLIFSSGHVVFGESKWVVDMEMASQLAGYNLHALRRWKKVISRRLCDERCIGILPWTNACERTLRHEFRDPEILGKLRTVHLACPKRQARKRNYDSDTPVFLFVSSINFPTDFEIKGGREVIIAFQRLIQSGERARLVVRAQVPSRYSALLANDSMVETIPRTLPWRDLEQLFLNADAFLFPGHHTPGKSILDAMSYGLPVVATNVWGTPEMVTKNNGILLEAPKNLPYVVDSVHPNWGSREFQSAIASPSDELVTVLEEAMRILCRDPGLRSRLGTNGRKMVDEGEFSLDRRNAALKEVFSKAE